MRWNVARLDAVTRRMSVAGTHTSAWVLAGTVTESANRPSFFVQAERAQPAGVS